MTCQWSPSSSTHDFAIARLTGTPLEYIQSASVHVCLFPSTDHHKHSNKTIATLSLAADADVGESVPKETVDTSFDPASLKCINDRCGRRRSASARRRTLGLAKRCGWQEVDVTAMLKSALQERKNKIAVRMVLEHKRASVRMRVQDDEPSRTEAPEACVTFKGAFSRLPQRFLPFLSVTQNRSVLRLYGAINQDSAPNCNARRGREPCHRIDTTFNIVRRSSSIFAPDRAGEQTGFTFDIYEPRLITLGKCVGGCSPTTQVPSQSRLINFYKMVGADVYDLLSTCSPVFSDEKLMRFKGRTKALYTDDGTRVRDYVAENRPWREVVACRCRPPETLQVRPDTNSTKCSH